MHLTDEQLEDVLQNEAEPSVARHAADCPDCRQRVEEARALQHRLRKAFSNVSVPPLLADRIRRRLSAGASSAAGTTAPSRAGQMRTGIRRFWPALAAAAALLAVAVPIGFYLGGPSTAQAAPAELIAIHQHNLTGNHGEFFSHDDPAKLAAYFKERLGFIPAMPQMNQGMSIRGCCVRKFRDQIVGSYVVNTPRGQVSIIVVDDPPEKLGMDDREELAGRTIWTGSFSGNSLAGMRVGNLTYCAVGQVPVENMSQLLVHLFETE